MLLKLQKNYKIYYISQVLNDFTGHHFSVNGLQIIALALTFAKICVVQLVNSFKCIGTFIYVRTRGGELFFFGIFQSLIFTFNFI